MLNRVESPTSIDLVLVFIGFGGGFLWTPGIRSVLEFARHDLRGVANGTTFMFTNMGFAIGIALVTAASALYLPYSSVSEIYLGSLNSLNSSAKLGCCCSKGSGFRYLYCRYLSW